MNADWGPLATVEGIVPTASWIACGFAALLAALACQGFFRLRATTLAAPCLWVALSASCLAVGTLVEAKFEGIGLSALKFAIAVTTFCPLMAVLGAKRPQDRGWQWVVLTLWIVLVWPAAQAALLPAGVRLELFIAWKLFLWGLIAVGLLNYLPTRYWLAALLVAAGQILLLQEPLGLLNELPAATPAGLICFALAAALVTWRNPSRDAMHRRSSKDIPNTLHPFEDQWQSFRNAYGAFWALRILGRVNVAAELRGWPLRLQWGGFQQENPPLTEKQLAELQQTWKALLRRFVDP